LRKLKNNLLRRQNKKS